MSKVFNVYSKNTDGNFVDRTWFNSSNIKYCECIDHENDLKTLKVVFNNGTQYQYNNINVNHYLLFREDLSQGKALNKYIKGNHYEYEKLENADIESLDIELGFRMSGGIFVSYDNDSFIMKDGKDNIIYQNNVKLSESTFNTICSALEAVGKNIKANATNLEQNDNNEDKPF